MDIGSYVGLSDADLITMVGAVFLPLVIAMIMKAAWSDRVRYTVSLAVYVLYAFASLWFLNYIVFDDSTTAKDIFRTFLLANVIGFGAFKLVWQPTGIAYTIEDSKS